MPARRSLLALAAWLLLAVEPVAAEPFSDLYIGAAITSDSDYYVDGTVVPPSILCLDDCGSAVGPAGGIRIGYFFDRFSWLGVAGDLSAFVTNWGLESPYSVTTIPITPLVLVRASLVKREGYPHGRVQPYLAVGPSMVITTAEQSEGFGTFGSGVGASDIGVDIGFDGRVGLRMMSADWVSVILEYRMTYFSPDWTIDGRDVETDFFTSHFTIGFGLHY